MSNRVKILGKSSGNIASLRFAIKRLGIVSECVDRVDKLKSSDILILPGMYNTYEYFKTIPDLIDIYDKQTSGKIKKIIGICAGFQILTQSIEEGDNKFSGLGLLDAITKPISQDNGNHNGWMRCLETANYLHDFGISKNKTSGLYYNHSCGVYPNNKTDFRYTYLGTKGFSISYCDENIFAVRTFQLSPAAPHLSGALLHAMLF